jgi:hypothetical protein
MATMSSVSRADRYNALSLARPIVVSLALFLVVVTLRLLDIFVLRLDELPDMINVSRLEE